MLAQQSKDLPPLLCRDGAIANHATNQRVGRFASPVQQENDGKRDFAFAEVAANRFSKGRGVRRVVEQVVDELEGNPEVEPVLA